MLLLNQLDIRTAYLIAGFASWLCSATLVLLRNYHRPLRTAALTMAAALASSGLCLFLAAQRDATSGPVALWFSVMGGSACFALMLEALRQMFGKRADFRICVATLTLQGVALMIATSPRSILLLHHGFQLVHCLLMLVVMLRTQEISARFSRYGMTALIVCYILGATLRWFESLYSPNLSLFTPGLTGNGVPGLVVLIYALSPIVVMIQVLAILNAYQVAELTHAASTDELTGLASRRFLLSTAAQWRKTVEGQNHSCALLMLDVDNFKSINDRFGHEIGDEVLRHLARTLNSNLRSDAVLARYGGEEFCALVPIERPAEAKAAAERLRQAVETSHFRKGVIQIKLTISAGVAIHASAQSLQEVLRVADRRVYLAKDLGRNCVVSEDPIALPELAQLMV